MVDPNDIFIGIIKAVEKFSHNGMEVFTADGIEIVLAISACFDQSGIPQQCKMMADSRLTLIEPFA